MEVSYGTKFKLRNYGYFWNLGNFSITNQIVLRNLRIGNQCEGFLTQFLFIPCAKLQEGEKAAAMQKWKYKKRKGDGVSGNSSSGPQQQQSSGKTKQVPKQKPRPRKQPPQTSSDINSVNIKSPNRENNKSNVPDTPPTTPRSPLRCATNTIPTTTITLS